MRSIERTLLIWILGALSLGAVLVALVSYLGTLDEMDEVFDAELKSIAEGFAKYHDAVLAPGASITVDSAARDDVADDSEIVTLTWSAEGRRVYASDPRVRVPIARVSGLARLSVDGEGWIVYSVVSARGVAQAAQRVSARRAMAGESAVQIMAPLLSLVAAVGALLAYGLRRGLEPLDHAARDVAARSATSLQPIPTDDVPEELSPLVVAISGLMARLDEAFTAQRRFLADAAHELRTPLTALRLQQQLLARAPDEASRREALVALEQGIERSQRLIEQLLQVSRAEPDGEPLHLEPVDLDALTMEVVSSLSPKADRLGIDLGAGLPTGARVAADRNHVEVLLTNLVDNALRYTPKGGVVDVCTAIDGDAVELVVTDTGPGIPEAERERVFDRFYRGEKATVLARETGGSGLGLAIVKAIALRHGATAMLSTPPAGRGLEVRVRFRPSDDRSATSAVAA